jgi:uncharacterized membrane protein
MADRFLNVLLLVAALGSGLIAGVFFAFSSFVMAALSRLPTPNAIMAMQSINIVVINPVFMAVFLGTGLLAAYLVFWAATHWSDPRSLWLMAGALAYIVGSVGVTMAFNVPLNDALATLAPTQAEGSRDWGDYRGAWTMWNTIRGVASLAASAAFIVAQRG